MKCSVIPEEIYQEWNQNYQMESFALILFASSMASNGIDVWLSGGLAGTPVALYKDAYEMSVIKTTTVMSAKDFTISNGPDLPKPLSGHCQIFINKNRVFIYGGVNSIHFNQTVTGQNIVTYLYSNKAYLWVNETWFFIPEENPCLNKGQDLTFQQPCIEMIESNQTRVVIVTFGNETSCTSILNLDTFKWSRIDDAETLIPIGGHLVTSLDKTRVFHLGGIYFRLEETQSLDIYELTSIGWEMSEAKLPFGISSNETKSYPSQHNVTLDY